MASQSVTFSKSINFIAFVLVPFTLSQYLYAPSLCLSTLPALLRIINSACSCVSGSVHFILSQTFGSDTSFLNFVGDNSFVGIVIGVGCSESELKFVSVVESDPDIVGGITISDSLSGNVCELDDDDSTNIFSLLSTMFGA